MAGYGWYWRTQPKKAVEDIMSKHNCWCRGLFAVRIKFHKFLTRLPIYDKSFLCLRKAIEDTVVYTKQYVTQYMYTKIKILMQCEYRSKGKYSMCVQMTTVPSMNCQRTKNYAI